MTTFHWLPVATDAAVRSRPWATLALVAANLVAFGAVLGIRGNPGTMYALAFKAVDPTVWTAISSLFVHGGVLQLLGNMIVLSLFGPALEARLGAFRYVTGYLVCGWLSNLAQAAAVLQWTPELSAIPIAGSDGAVSGILGIFAVRLSFARLRLVSANALLREGAVRPARLAIPAALGIAVWFAAPVIARLAGADSGGTLVARWSGGLFGAAFAIVMGLLPAARIERRLAVGALHEKRGDWHAALGEVEGYLRSLPDDPEALAQAGRLFRVTHQDAQAAECFRRAIQSWLRRGDMRQACDAYQEMRRLLGSQAALPPVAQLRVARSFEDLGRASEASRAYEAYGREYPERHAAVLALLRSADIERRALNNPGRARYIYEELLRRDLPPDLATMVRERKQVAERALEQLPLGAV